MRTLQELLIELDAAGASPALSPEGKLKVSFGDAKVPSSLVADLRAHADELKQMLPNLQPRHEATILDEKYSSFGVESQFTKWSVFDGKMGNLISWDCETEEINKARPDLIPPLALMVATDGDNSFFIAPEQAEEFFSLHREHRFIGHNIAFDISVLANHLNQPINNGFVWDMVEANRFDCTQEMERLLLLGFDGAAPKRPPNLSQLAEQYLGQPLGKDAVDVTGKTIRTSFGKYLGQSINVLPKSFLQYAAEDAVAPLLIHYKQMAREAQILRTIVPQAFGKLSEELQKHAREHFGPLGIQIWIRANLICQHLKRVGIDIDQGRCQQLLQQLDSGIAQSIEEIRAAGIPMPNPGESRPKGMVALSTAIRNRLIEKEPELLKTGKISQPFERTEKGLLKMTAEEKRDWAAAEIDPVISSFSRHDKLSKMKSFVEGIEGNKIHPNWLSGKASGRFGCESPNVQQWPKCGKHGKVEGLTNRQITMLPEGKVAVVADFAQLEMAGLGCFHHHQMGWGSSLWNQINEAVDMYCSVYRLQYGREPSKAERAQMKPAVLGRPAGMGALGIVNDAKKNWNMVLDVETVQKTVVAYEELVPELKIHLSQTRDAGAAASSLLELNSKNEAWKIFRLLEGNYGELSEEQIESYWDKAQGFESIIETRSASSLKAVLKALKERRPSKALATAVRNSLAPQPMQTLSGRIRGKCSFTECRNQVFQACSADGAILCIWNLLREGFDVRMFVHDEAVVVIDNDSQREEKKKQIEKIMTETMSSFLGGIRISVESIISRSWSSLDEVKEPPPAPAPAPKKKSLLKGTVGGKQRQKKVDSVGNGGRRTFTDMVKENKFDDGTLPF